MCMNSSSKPHVSSKVDGPRHRVPCTYIIIARRLYGWPRKTVIETFAFPLYANVNLQKKIYNA